MLEFADRVENPLPTIESQTALKPSARTAVDKYLDYADVFVEPDKSPQPERRPNAADLSDTVATDVPLTDDSLFSKYLRLPTLSPSPAELVDRGNSGTASVIKGRGFLNPPSEDGSPRPDLEDALCSHSNQSQANASRAPIRLRLNPPKARIILRVPRRDNGKHKNGTSRRR